MLNLPHRDDMDMKDVQEMEKKFKEIFGPDVKIAFAGDVPEHLLPPGFLEETQVLQRLFLEKFVKGQCIDCENVIPGWPDVPEDLPEDFDYPSNWYHFEDEQGNITGWQCPECNAKEEQEDAQED